MSLPRANVEHTLKEIVREVLNNSKVRLENNFFDQGGDSLKSMRVIAKIREVLKVKITFKEFFACKDLHAVVDIVLEKLAALNLNYQT